MLSNQKLVLLSIFSHPFFFFFLRKHAPPLAIISLLPKLPDFSVKFCRILSESQRLFCTACALALLWSSGLLCCCEFYILFLSTNSSLLLLLSKIFLIPKDFRVRRISVGKTAGKHTDKSLSEFKRSCTSLWIAVSIPGVQWWKATRLQPAWAGTAGHSLSLPCPPPTKGYCWKATRPLNLKAELQLQFTTHKLCHCKHKAASVCKAANRRTENLLGLELPQGKMIKKPPREQGNIITKTAEFQKCAALAAWPWQNGEQEKVSFEISEPSATHHWEVQPWAQHCQAAHWDCHLLYPWMSAGTTFLRGKREKNSVLLILVLILCVLHLLRAGNKGIKLSG